MKRRRIIAIVLAILAIVMIVLTLGTDSIYTSDRLYRFYLTNFVEHTGSDNAVTAIYLNYRLFDTFFETLLLVLSVIGIIYFSKHEGDY